jgi:hypothetical protein
MKRGTAFMSSKSRINILFMGGSELPAWHEGRNYRLPIKTEPALLNTVAVNTVEDVPPADDTPRLASV